MRCGSMLIYGFCRLSTAIANRAVEIQGGDAMLAEDAFECGAAVHRFDGVISHIFYGSPSTCLGLGAIGVQP